MRRFHLALIWICGEEPHAARGYRQSLCDSICLACSAGAEVSGRDIACRSRLRNIMEIILAIESKDGPLAERLTREHALVARRNLEIALAELEKLSRLRMPGTSLIKLG